MRRINAMEHPAYNTWTYREKLAMPEVRCVIIKFLFASFFLLVFLTLYFTLGACIFLAIPIFHSEHSALLEEQWKNNTGCLSPPLNNMVILNCLDTEFTIDQHAFLNETIARTLLRLTDDNPHAATILNDFLDCQNDDGWCRTCIFITLDELARNPTTVFGLSFLSATLTLFAVLLSYGPAPRYFRKLRAHLSQSSAEGVKFGNMSSKQKDEYLTTLASPDLTPTTVPAFPFSTSSHDGWTIEDEDIMMQSAAEDSKPEANGLRNRSVPLLPSSISSANSNGARPRTSLL